MENRAVTNPTSPTFLNMQTLSVEHIVLLSAAIAIVAFLYSSVGHAGASGYIAVMTLFGLAAATIKPASLVLNILVASLTAWQFWRAAHFSWQLFWPFAVLSVPLAFLGGYVNLPTRVFKILIGLVLLYSAIRFLIETKSDKETHEPSKAIAISTGAGLGLLSGLTGTGGGIFLTPILIFMRWAKTKTASAVSALFILVNSISGLLGNISGTKQLPLFALPLAVAAVSGGAVGSYLGSRQFSPGFIKKLLAVVLVIAGFKLIFA
ncbi:MAG: sulfite exporter TauE/SafE family protein [Acidobacteriota bacterium]|nr:sulfite exporter TauE/SafE family protein [Acidobacteriota bacterium]